MKTALALSTVAMLMFTASSSEAVDCNAVLSLLVQGASPQAVSQFTGVPLSTISACQRQAVASFGSFNPAGPPPFDPAGPGPINAAGPAPMNAAGPAPFNAAGPAPFNAAGPAPRNAAGPAPHNPAGIPGVR